MRTIRSFDANQVSMAAHGTLTNSNIYPHGLRWFPTHMFVTVHGVANPNELANAERDIALSNSGNRPPSVRT